MTQKEKYRPVFKAKAVLSAIREKGTLMRYQPGAE